MFVRNFLIWSCWALGLEDNDLGMAFPRTCVEVLSVDLVSRDIFTKRKLEKREEREGRKPPREKRERGG